MVQEHTKGSFAVSLKQLSVEDLQRGCFRRFSARIASADVQQAPQHLSSPLTASAAKSLHPETPKPGNPARSVPKSSCRPWLEALLFFVFLVRR